MVLDDGSYVGVRSDDDNGETMSRGRVKRVCVVLRVDEDLRLCGGVCEGRSEGNKVDGGLVLLRYDAHDLERIFGNGCKRSECLDNVGDVHGTDEYQNRMHSRLENIKYRGRSSSRLDILLPRAVASELKG